MKINDARQKLIDNKSVWIKGLDNYDSIFSLKDFKTITSYQFSSRTYFMFLATYNIVINNDLITARNWFFHAALSDLYKARYHKNGIGNVNSINSAIPSLLSDDIIIFKSIPNWKNKIFHEENIKRGVIFYIIKNLIAHDYKTANDLWLKGKSHPVKKASWYTIERKILRAMIDKDDEKTIEAIMEFLTPENIEKSLDDVFVSGYFFNTMTIAYLKLAYHLGMNIDIKHELVPKELVEFKPLDNYEIKYDFMKRDDIKDILDV